MAATFQKLVQTTLASSASNISVTSIPQTYDALIFYASLRADPSSARVSAEIRINNSTSNVTKSEIYLENDAFGVEINNTTGFVGGISAAQGNSNTFTNFVGILPNYKTSNHKVMYGRFMQPNNTSINYSMWNTFVTLKDSTAVSSIYIYPGSGNIIAGSELTVYGLKYS